MSNMNETAEMIGDDLVPKGETIFLSTGVCYEISVKNVIVWLTLVQ